MRLFDEAVLRKLEQLTLSAAGVRVGVMKGDRRSRRRGASIEFADYRNYASGDDLRRLDWNVFARLNRPFIKLTQEEEDLAVHILVDTSSSMNWPRADDKVVGDECKLRYAVRLAGALGYVGLSGGDLVMVTLFDGNGQRGWGPFRGRANGWPLLQFLEANYNALTGANEAARHTALDPALRQYALRGRRPGLLFLISDLLSPGGWRDGLTALLARGYEIALLHTFSPDEARPEAAGDLRLVDVETGETAEVTLDPAGIEAYLARLAEWQAGIDAFCTARGVHYAKIMTDMPWDALIYDALRRQGVVR